MSAAELLGILFKTHRSMINNIVQKMRGETLQQAFSSTEQKRLKFGLCVLDDMIEFLGPSYFSADDYLSIVNTIC